MKTGITILVVMFVSITILLIIAYTIKHREKYTDLPPLPSGNWKNSCDNNFNTDQWGNFYILCETGNNPPGPPLGNYYPFPHCNSNNYENIDGNLTCSS